MIVGLKPVGLALARVVKMYADKDCIFLRVLHRDAVVERNKHVGVSRHDGLYLRLAQSRVLRVFICARGSLASRRWATSSVTVFSGGPERRYAPLSSPPWPASTTTVANVLVVFLTPGVPTVLHAANDTTNTSVTMRAIRRAILI